MAHRPGWNGCSVLAGNDRKMAAALLQRDDEAASLSGLTLHPDGSAMQLHQLAYQRKADSAALVRTRCGTLDAMKPLEQSRNLLRRDAHARIFDGQRYILAPGLQAHCNNAFKCVLEGIRQQVENDLLPHLPVDMHQPG